MNEKNSWLYQLKMQSAPQIGGYIKRFEKNKLTIDLATVKGAGHMVPVYRAGPILQLLTNFIRRNDYNDALAFTSDRKSLLPEFMIHLLEQARHKVSDIRIKVGDNRMEVGDTRMKFSDIRMKVGDIRAKVSDIRVKVGD
ncbi:unnamed protein product, partial [Wuchereria bancrofti]